MRYLGWRLFVELPMQQQRTVCVRGDHASGLRGHLHCQLYRQQNLQYLVSPMRLPGGPAEGLRHLLRRQLGMLH
jgi:hypothetical protein